MTASASRDPLSQTVQAIFERRPNPGTEIERTVQKLADHVRERRTSLWELNASVHCSVIGTCLTTAELRKIMGRLLGRDLGGVSDHDLHGQAVGLCGRHGEGSKALQKALDLRHRPVINRFAKLQNEEAALAQWAEALRTGDIAGAYWAVLTHPQVGSAGLRRAFGDVHMLSHLVGAANRADIQRLAALEQANAALAEKVERQQRRLHEVAAGRDATIRRLTALAAGQAAHQSRTQPGDDDALAGLRHLVAALQERLDRETVRRERLEQRLTAAVATSRKSECWARIAKTEAAALRCELALMEQANAAGPGRLGPAQPPAQQILYVGGRPGCVDQIRAVLDAAGGSLLVHDGGEHDHPSLLPGLIGRADHVVFPVECVSHDAALMVKKVCRQLGKPWSPLRSAGVSSFLAAFASETSGNRGYAESPSMSLGRPPRPEMA